MRARNPSSPPQDVIEHRITNCIDAVVKFNFHISEKIKERIEPLPRFEIEAASEAGRDMLLVRVHADVHPPYYYSADVRREAYIRVGNQSVVAPPGVLNELILRGTNRTWDGLDSQIPRDRASFTVLKATYANRMRNSLDEADLESFGLFTDHGTLTNAGALLADEPLLRQTFRENYLRPALDAGLIERTIPDKPNSRNQKYRRAR